MRIDKLNHVASYNNVSPDKAAKKPAEGKSAYSTDRVEVASQPSVNEIKDKIKENVMKLEKQPISSEKLEALKQRISQNNYHVDTTDIIKSIL